MSSMQKKYSSDIKRERSDSPPPRRRHESSKSSARPSQRDNESVPSHSPRRRHSPAEERDYRRRKDRRSRSRSRDRKPLTRPSDREDRNPVRSSAGRPPSPNQSIDRRSDRSTVQPSNQAIDRRSDQSTVQPSNQAIDRRHTESDGRQVVARRGGRTDSPAGRMESHPWGNEAAQNEERAGKDDVKKDKPNFALSGKLLEDTNTVNGVVITYAQPPEARIPKVRWRLYPFKGDEALATMYLHRQSAYLLGRDRRIADIPLDHPSCSKQHAVIQFRLIPLEKPDGTVVRRVKPYIIDLNSGNGSMVNGKKIEPQRYVELLEKDVIKFGFSSREYVMLHEGSKDADDDYRSEGEEDALNAAPKPKEKTEKAK